jgi:ribonuclease R
MHIVSLLLFSLAFSSQKKERMSIEPNGINNDMSNTKKMKQVSTKPDSIVFPPDPNETAEQVVDRVFLSFGLTEKFPKACHEHVEKFLKNEPTADTNLKDLTDIPFVTIDNDNSMDLDQAMWICRADPPVKGVVPHRHENAAGYLVSYALADGAYFVPVMSPLFQHALTRGGTSYYLPGKCIPMLPRALSEDVMSLNPHVKRRALVFDMYLSEEGSVLKTFYTWAVIRSLWKGTYREVAAYYDARDAGKPSLLAEQVYTETLDLLREVGLLRRKLAFMRDVVDYKREGSAIGIRDGKLVFVKKERYSSEQYNEQISLLCNTEGARLLAFLDELEEASGKDVLYPIYRTQDAPRKDQVFTLRAVISNSLKAHNLNMTEWTWQKDGESIAAYVRKLRVHLESLPPSSTDYRRWTNVVNVIERQAMITNVAASFTSDPAQGHHSLKMSHYARFSSPMRELVGCYTHWGLWETRNDGGGNSELSQSESIARKYTCLILLLPDLLFSHVPFLIV